MLLGLALLAGCGTLPRQGPSAADIAPGGDGDDRAALPYAIVDLTPALVARLGRPRGADFPAAVGALGGRSAPSLGAGDRLQVTVFEASGDGLFSTAESRNQQMEVVVDEFGRIFIPYVGQITAGGRSVEQVRASIQSGLEGQAIEPQVQLTLTGNGGQKVTVLGDVAEPGRYDVPPSGLRLVEAIAQAGGALNPAWETEVTVVRGAARGTIRLDAILSAERNNIWLTSRDTVELAHDPRSFTAFGAVARNGVIPLETEVMSLAEAVAATGGLRDEAADAGGVFVFRFEAAERLAGLGVPLPAMRSAGRVPTIFRLDFEEPQAFFTAGAFAIADKDILYVANAPATEFRKFVGTVLSPFLGTARGTQILTQ